MNYYLYSNYEELDKVVISKGEKSLLISSEPFAINTIRYVGDGMFEFVGMEELGSFDFNLFEGNKILLPINHLYDEVDDLLKYENFKSIELDFSDIKGVDAYGVSDYIRKENLIDEKEFK